MKWGLNEFLKYLTPSVALRDSRLSSLLCISASPISRFFSAGPRFISSSTKVQPIFDQLLVFNLSQDVDPSKSGVICVVIPLPAVYWNIDSARHVPTNYSYAFCILMVVGIVEVLKQCPLTQDLVRDKILYFYSATIFAPLPLCGCWYVLLLETVRDEIQLTLEKNSQNCKHSFCLGSFLTTRARRYDDCKEDSLSEIPFSSLDTETRSLEVHTDSLALSQQLSEQSAVHMVENGLWQSLTSEQDNEGHVAEMTKKWSPVTHLGDWYTLQKNLFLSSYIPLSKYKSQVVCWKERLRGIVFDRTVIFFFERASNCTNVQYFGALSNYFCTPQFRVYPDRIELLLDSDGCTSGSRLWKNTDCLSFLRLCSRNQSTHGVHVVSVPRVVDVLGEVVRQQYVVLPGMQEMFGRIRVQAKLKPFLLSSFLLPRSISNLNWTVRRYPTICQVVKSHSSIIFSMNCVIMSQQSDVKFWHFKTTLTEFSRFNVYPFSFPIRSGHGRQR